MLKNGWIYTIIMRVWELLFLCSPDLLGICNPPASALDNGITAVNHHVWLLSIKFSSKWCGAYGFRSLPFHNTRVSNDSICHYWVTLLCTYQGLGWFPFLEVSVFWQVTWNCSFQIPPSEELKCNFSYYCEFRDALFFVSVASISRKLGYSQYPSLSRKLGDSL